MSNIDCIFCKIIQGEIPSTNVYEDDQLVAFFDINPLAPTHIIIVPKIHIASVNDIKPEHENTIGHLFVIGRKLAEVQGIAESGYRLVINTGPDGLQSVYHLHLHLLGGRRMGSLG